MTGDAREAASALRCASFSSFSFNSHFLLAARLSLLSCVYERHSLPTEARSRAPRHSRPRCPRVRARSNRARSLRVRTLLAPTCTRPRRGAKPSSVPSASRARSPPTRRGLERRRGRLPMNGTHDANDPCVGSASTSSADLTASRSLFVRAIYGYDGSSTGSLSFQKGDIIEVITKLERCASRARATRADGLAAVGGMAVCCALRSDGRTVLTRPDRTRSAAGFRPTMSRRSRRPRRI